MLIIGRFGFAGLDPRKVLFQTPETVRISLSENVARVPNQLTDRVIFVDSIGPFSLTGATSRPLTSLFSILGKLIHVCSVREHFVPLSWWL